MAGNEPGITNFTGLNVGGGRNLPSGTSYAAILTSVVTVVATTVTATKSVDTTATIPGLAVGDPVFATAGTSGLSAGVTMDCWVSAASTVNIRYSNVSTANAAQIATEIHVTALKRA